MTHLNKDQVSILLMEDGTDTLTSNWSSSLPDWWTDSHYAVVDIDQGKGYILGEPSLPFDTLISIENYYQTGTNGINYMVIGDDSDNTLSTSLGDDIIDGGAGDDSLYGNDGNDTISSGSGDDKLYGGDGRDTLISTGSGNQLFDGGKGVDTFKVDTSIFSLSAIL